MKQVVSYPEVKQIIRYPNNLLRIETGQQSKQLSLFDNEGKLNPTVANEINKSIERILNLNKNDDNYSIELPYEIEKIIPVNVRNKITKELTGNEVRVLTAVLALSQEAESRGDLYFFEKTNQAYFEFNLSQLYELSGLKKEKTGNYSRNQREMIRMALTNLHRKEFLIPKQYFDSSKKSEYRGVKIEPLMQIHEIGEWTKVQNRKKTQVFKITVSGIFFDYKQRSQTYFNLPANLNRQLRTINKGRPIIGIELFIKCLYQAIHCARKTDQLEYSHNRLIEIMKLDKHKRNKNYDRINKTIHKAFETAIKLGIIDSWKEEKTKWSAVKYVLKIHKK